MLFPFRQERYGVNAGTNLIPNQNIISRRNNGWGKGASTANSTVFVCFSAYIWKVWRWISYFLMMTGHDEASKLSSFGISVSSLSFLWQLTDTHYFVWLGIGRRLRTCTYKLLFSTALDYNKTGSS